MEEFMLTINLGNDAMTDPDDVARALDRVAARLRDIGSTKGTIRDDNGGDVGQFKFI